MNAPSAAPSTDAAFKPFLLSRHVRPFSQTAETSLPLSVWASCCASCQEFNQSFFCPSMLIVRASQMPKAINVHRKQIYCTCVLHVFEVSSGNVLRFWHCGQNRYITTFSANVSARKRIIISSSISAEMCFFTHFPPLNVLSAPGSVNCPARPGSCASLGPRTGFTATT